MRRVYARKGWDCRNIMDSKNIERKKITGERITRNSIKKKVRGVKKRRGIGEKWDYWRKGGEREKRLRGVI